MKGRCIYFFNYLGEEIDRIPLKIIAELYKQNSFDHIILLYSKGRIKSDISSLYRGVVIIRLSLLDQREIQRVIKAYPPQKLVVITETIPDMYILSIFNKLSIQTFLIQEGLLVPFLERLPFWKLMIHKATKILQYSLWAKYLSKAGKGSYFSVMKDLYRIHISGNKYLSKSKILQASRSIAGNAFIFDDSWDSFFINIYGYQKKQLIHVGEFDYMQLAEIRKKNQEDSICYICQTLVEDGRYPINKFDKFLKILDYCLSKDVKLYIKLHPRSKIEIYSILSRRENVVLTNNFPNCRKYIGHYSSMLSLAYQCSPYLFLWYLENHGIPDYFRKFGYMIGNRTVDLQRFIIEDCSSWPTPEYYQPISNEELVGYNPFKKIAVYLSQGYF